MYTVIERIVPPGVEPLVRKFSLPTLKGFTKVYRADLIQVQEQHFDTHPPVCYSATAECSKHHPKRWYSVYTFYALKKFI